MRIIHMWQKDKEFCTMIQLSSTIDEFVDEVCKQMELFCEHLTSKTVKQHI